MNKSLNIIIIIIIGIILGGNSALAEAENKSVFGIKFGQFNEGTLIVNNSDYETTSGLAGGVFLDIPVLSVMDVGFTVDIAELDLITDKEYLLDIGCAAKIRYQLIENRLTLKPGIGFGIALLREIGPIDNSKYLTFKAFSEMVYHLNPKNGLLGELGFLWAPWGGDGTLDITGGPFMYFRGGLVF